DGKYEREKAPPVRTYRGSVRGSPDSRVAGAWLDNGLTLRILDVAGDLWLEPEPGADPRAHRVSRLIAPSGGACGNGGSAPAQSPPIAPRGEGPWVAELACDTDHEYYEDHGSVNGCVNRIESVVNVMNLQFERDVDISHRISVIVIRPYESDAYDATSFAQLLAEVRNEWETELAYLDRDMVKLFAGRNMSDGLIGGAASIGGICTDDAYCYSLSDCCGSLGCAVDLAAHVIGHLWGATHCLCDDPPSTMNATLTCSNNFGAQSVTEIIVRRTEAPCLSFESTEPVNDNCPSAIMLTMGVATPFNTLGATTDGPDEPGLCSNAGDTHVRNDVWFEFVAECDGAATVDVCGSLFDTKLAIYTACPAGSGELLACNDDFDCDGDGGVSDDGFVSRITWPVFLGGYYLVRVGGFNGATGSGTITVTCAAESCAGETVATAIPIFSLPVVIDGSTDTCGNNYDEDCGIGASDAGDVVYKLRPTADMTIDVRLCGSSYDTKVFIYEDAVTPGSPYACNDDSLTCGAAPPAQYRSFLNDVSLEAWSTYYVVIDGWNGAEGAYHLEIIDETPILLANDDCENATWIAEGQTPFTNVGATTDGPDEPNACFFASYSQIDADVWFAYSPGANGMITVDVCNRNYDTKMAIYADCPTASGQTIACVDDACGSNGLGAKTTFHGLATDTYLIRVGGYLGHMGSGIIEISLTPDAACPGDLNGDRVIDLSDLAGLLSAFGTMESDPGYIAAADIDGSGSVDLADLAGLLSGFGTSCP
ncbi:MAG: hypothetical protein KDA32_07160, partial [Phycisphaerales bacterium]|nr:hypothetical protein [Phycisphaerales bacterium]